MNGTRVKEEDGTATEHDADDDYEKKKWMNIKTNCSKRRTHKCLTFLRSCVYVCVRRHQKNHFPSIGNSFRCVLFHLSSLHCHLQVPARDTDTHTLAICRPSFSGKESRAAHIIMQQSYQKHQATAAQFRRTRGIRHSYVSFKRTEGRQSSNNLRWYWLCLPLCIASFHTWHEYDAGTGGKLQFHSFAVCEYIRAKWIAVKWTKTPINCIYGTGKIAQE